ncbi:MFS transporter [Actinoplanes sp. NPDC024001]|uniref:MFS transporter n=1 Tax=Actinoplanes sp. NPDC024001 TaxID=3154598 RepID=UPI0033D25538
MPIGRRWMLIIALLGYFLTAWAWALLGPLAPLLHDRLGLTPLVQALVVALPVVVGALGRIPAGAFADRFGSRRIYLLVTALTIGALLVLATVGHRSPPALLGGAVLLGAAGTTFAAAVPFVSAWYPGDRRGLAIGALGTGLCGGAIGGLTAVRLVDAYGMAAPFLATAAALAAFAVLVAVAMRDAPRPAPPAATAGGRLSAALRLPITGRAVVWYALGFALFVTCSNALPVYLGNAYGVSPARAGDVMAAFVVTGVAMRPVGGWLADRFGPPRPLVVALTALTAATAVQAFTPPLPVLLALVLPVMAVGLGISSTSVLAQISHSAPAAMVGLVTGVVSAVAGVAGFLTPLLLALSFQRTGGYAVAFGVLGLAALVALSVAVRQLRRPT